VRRSREGIQGQPDSRSRSTARRRQGERSSKRAGRCSDRLRGPGQALSEHRQRQGGRRTRQGAFRKQEPGRRLLSEIGQAGFPDCADTQERVGNPDFGFRIFRHVMEPSPQLSSRPLDLIAKRKVEGLRLDQYLVAQFPDYSRTLIGKAIDAGSVLVNGASAKASYKVRNGDQIRIWLPESTHPAPMAEDIPLQSLYEDEFLAII